MTSSNDVKQRSKLKINYKNQMTRLNWSTQKKKVNDLLPYSKNPRQISKEQMTQLKKSLQKFNLAEVPCINTDGRIVAGHQRIKALQLLGRGDEFIDVRVPNRKLTKEEFDQYLISSNKITGEWDFEALKAFDLDILVDIGFSKTELENIWSENLEVEGDDFDEEAELAKIRVPKTRLGDLIVMGQHKLICGSSTDPDILKKLFGDERTSMIASDPPYNIKLDYNGGVGGKKNYGGNVNDNRSDDEYKEFIKKTLENALAVTKPDAHVFCWSDSSYIWLIQTLYRELGIKNKRVCLWLKNNQNPTPGVAFSKVYEPCTYGIRGKPYIAPKIHNLNEVMNKEITTGNNLLEEALDHLDVWMTKRLSGKDYEHATSKPPKLHEKAIRRCTKPGDIILDSFLGSGSTLIAAEQLKRRCYAVELEPIFCDLVIKRWEKLTNKKAKIIRNEKDRKKTEFLDQLRKIPIVQVACEKSGLSRNTVYRWRKEDQEFMKSMEQALAEGEELINEMTESQLLTLIKNQNYSAISFWLRHRNPKFRERVEVTAHIKAPKEELTPEQEALVKEALRLASFTKDEEEIKKESKINQNNDKSIITTGNSGENVKGSESESGNN